MNKTIKTLTMAALAAFTFGFAPSAQAGNDDCITFSSSASFKLSVENPGWTYYGMLFTSTNKTDWEEWDGSEEVEAGEDGEGNYVLYVRGEEGIKKISSGDFDSQWNLSGSADIACTGNIETLRGATGDEPSETTMEELCYARMFSGCTALTEAPALPATTLAYRCYQYMFEGCTALTTAPDLPAEKLANLCYEYMFDGCTALTSAPALNATTLAEGCYQGMFQGCTALTAAPELSATTLAVDCYQGMFQGCTSLETAPELPATTLADRCYSSMFYECKALESPAMMDKVTTIGDASCYLMYYGCEKLKVNTGSSEGYAKGWAVNATSVGPNWNYMMFAKTAGSFTGAPALNTTYYIKDDPTPPTTPVEYREPVYKTEGDPKSGIKEWKTGSATDYTVVTSDMTTWGAAGQTSWYVVASDVTISSLITCVGDVRLILKDGFTLTASAGIEASTVTEGYLGFTVYAQSEGEAMGKLVATGDNFSAGIGGGAGHAGYNITLNGGAVTATGGYYGAGIGGGYAPGSNITINGGTVTATGVGNSAGIGGGGGGYGPGSDITINGGTVTATGGDSAAGIGGGFSQAGSNITLNGGTVFVYTPAPAYGSVDCIGSGRSGAAASGVVIDSSAKVFFNLADTTMPASFEGFTIKTPETPVARALVGGIANWTAGKTFNLVNASTAATGTITVNDTKGTVFANKLLKLPHADSKLTLTVEDPPPPVEYREPVYKTEGDPKSGIKEWKTGSAADYTVVTSDMTTWGAAGQTSWYVVASDVTISSLITCVGDVRLILKDGFTLTASAGIEASTVTEGYLGFTVYAQSEGESMGKLVATGGDFSAGIGGGAGHAGCNITLNGGAVTATGGYYGAGIGGGYAQGSNITINGGTVTATGVGNSAGIGGGGGGLGPGSDITINGGTVTATGGDSAAGIGGGLSKAGSNITLNGGTVFVYTPAPAYGSVDCIGSGRSGAAASGVVIDSSAKVFFNLADTTMPASFEGFTIKTPETPVARALVGGIANWTAGKTFNLVNASTAATGTITVNDTKGTVFANKLLKLPHADSKLTLTVENPPEPVATVTISGVTTPYETIVDAWTAACVGRKANPATLTLLKDVTTTSTLYMQAGEVGDGVVMTLDLNGCVLRQTAEGERVILNDGGTLTVKDSHFGEAGYEHYFTPSAKGGWDLTDTPTQYVVKGGVITGGNPTDENGGGAIANGGLGTFTLGRSTLTILSGNIAGNRAARGGGVGNKWDMTVSGGAICYNYATYSGGGIGNQSVVEISGGEIYGNTASGEHGGAGGGVANEFYMEISGGEIYGNTAFNGGGVSNIKDKKDWAGLWMSGGVIRDNVTTSPVGGTAGLYNASGAEAYLEGGAITNNAGIGVLHAGESLTLCGTAIITGVKESSYPSLYLTSGKTVTITNDPAFAEGAYIGVYTMDEPTRESPVLFATNAQESDAKYFHSDVGTNIFYAGGNLYLGEAPEPIEDCITFSSEGAFSLATANTSKNWNGTLWTSTDKTNWTVWEGASVDAAQTGETGPYNLYVRGDTANTVITGNDQNHRWVLTGSNISCSGNIEALRGATGNNPSPTAMNDHCYAYMFYGCTELTTAPALAAATLAQGCYSQVFEGCTKLTTAPALPATTLAESCCYRMFANCTALTAAPELPVMTLAKSCYNTMFFGCSSLTNAPALPAETLTVGCYMYMFAGTALTEAPELPATTLATDCYFNMFNDCQSLTAVPELPARGLVSGCYMYMFSGCKGIKLYPEGTGDVWSMPEGARGSGNWGESMFAGTGGDLQGQPEIGKDYYYKQLTPCDDCLTFSSAGAFTVSMAVVGNPPSVNVEYSTDKLHWTAWEYLGQEQQAVLSGSEYVFYVRGTGNTHFADSVDHYHAFVLTPASEDGKIACSGNIETMLDWETVSEGEHPEIGYNTYQCLFRACMALTSCPSFPSHTYYRCYANMFEGCTALTRLPEISVTNLAEACCEQMFNACSGIILQTTDRGLGNWQVTFSGSGEVVEGWNADMLSSTGGTFTDNPAYNTTYYYGVPKHSIFYSVTEGSGGVEVPETAEEGATVTVTLTPDGGYKLGSISAISAGETVPLTPVAGKEGKEYTFTMPTANVDISVAFVSSLHYINSTVTPEDSGWVYVSDTAAEGDEVTVTLYPEWGYVFVSISATAGGESVPLTPVTEGEEYTFKMPTNDVTIAAVFGNAPVGYREPVYKTEGDPTSGIQGWQDLSVSDYTVVTSATSAVTWGTAGETIWYVVRDSELQIDGGVTCVGQVNLILADGASLTVANVAAAKAGIATDPSGSFTIYGQTESNGALTVTGGNDGAGIGGGYAAGGSNIMINGGIVTTTGGASGAGIGGGQNGAAQNIVINGGTVTATGANGGAGIGGGYLGAGSNIVINGGTVVAKVQLEDLDYHSAAGIGGGEGASASNITINGGTVTALGGYGDAAIGGGMDGSCSNVKIAEGATVLANTPDIKSEGDYISADVIGKGAQLKAEVPLTASGVVIQSGAKIFYNLTGLANFDTWEIEPMADMPESFDGMTIMTPETQVATNRVLVGGVAEWAATTEFGLRNTASVSSKITVNDTTGTQFANRLLKLPYANSTLALTAEPVPFDINTYVTSGEGTGTIATDPAERAPEGATVYVTVSPATESGYAFDSIAIFDDNGNDLSYTTWEEGKRFSFIMPSSGASVYVSFTQGPTPTEPAITGVTAMQRYPWNGLVDIGYEVSGTIPENYELKVQAKDGGMQCEATTIKTDASPLAEGAHTLVWDMNADGFSNVVDGVVFTVAAESAEGTAIYGDSEQTRVDLRTGTVREIAQSTTETLTYSTDYEGGTPPKHEGVQLWAGGPYFAEKNIGAESSTDYGYYFWWGDTVGYVYDGSSNAWTTPDGSGKIEFSAKDNTASQTYNKDNEELYATGWIDENGNLVSDRDAATAHLKSPWRMMTGAEMNALISNCDWNPEYDSDYNFIGCTVRGREAYAQNSIFLPSAGYGDGSNLLDTNANGNYWSSTPYSGNSTNAWSINLIEGYGVGVRYFGYPIRPVQSAAENKSVTITVTNPAGVTETLISGESGSGMVNWTPSATGTNELHHIVYAADGSTVITNIVAYFYVQEAATYNISVVKNPPEGGSVTDMPESSAAGVEIFFTVTADESSGYSIGEVTAAPDAGGKKIKVVDRGGGTYSFVMPAESVTVTATFTQGPTPTEPKITNVAAMQRYPWNGLVDIGYEVSGTIPENYELKVRAKDGGMQCEATTIKTDASPLAEGAHTLVWDMNADGFSNVVDGVVFTVAAESAEGTVIYGDSEQTRVDLRTGTVREIAQGATETLTFSTDYEGGPTPPVPEGVQLWAGGPYFAETNIGAENPQDYGYYFWWGDTVGYVHDEMENAWMSADASGQTITFAENDKTASQTYGKSIKDLQDGGWIDENGNLASAHDAATVHLGSPWRMPTYEEIDALVSGCKWQEVTDDAGNYIGHKVSGTGEYAQNSIFLPAAGRGDGSDLGFTGFMGYYWSSTPNSDASSNAWGVRFSEGAFGSNSAFRYGGLPIRPVQSAAANGAASGAGNENETVTITVTNPAGVTETLISGQSGFGTVDWTPSATGTNELHHIVYAADGSTVITNIVAYFYVQEAPPQVPVATVSIGGGEAVEYTDINTAWTAAQAGTEQAPAVLTLLKDVTTATTLYMDSSSGTPPVMTLDLNGCVLQQTTAGRRVIFNYGGTLTVKDSHFGEDAYTHYFAKNGDTWSLTDKKTEYAVKGGVITGGNINETSDGGAIYNESATFTILSGNIAGNSNIGSDGSYDGGAIINYQGKFRMEGGEVCYNFATDTGAGIVVDKGTTDAQILGGKIHDNTTQMGGGVAVNADAELTVTGGAFYNNTATGTGGGAIGNKGWLEVAGGEFYGNTADSGVGGAIGNIATLIVGNAVITGNSAYAGGGIANAGMDPTKTANLVMTGGVVRANFAWEGAGVYNYQGEYDDPSAGGSYPCNANATITGGTIVDNNGAGVYNAGTYLTLGGSVVIAGSSESGTPVGLYLPSGFTAKVSTAKPFVKGASIGVTTESDPVAMGDVQITSNGAAGDVAYFTSDAGYTVAKKTTGLWLLAKGIQVGEDAWANVVGGVCTITGNGPMWNLTTKSTNPLADYQATMTDIVVDYGVTDIGAQFFHKFRAVTNVTVAASVTNVADYAFFRCESIDAIAFGADQGAVNIGTKSIVYYLAITPEGKTYTVPAVTFNGKLPAMLGTETLENPKWELVEPDQEVKYHFFKLAPMK